MTKSEQYYASKLAIAARKSCVDAGILEENDKKLDIDRLSKIVYHFGGLLGIDKESNPYIVKYSNKSFDIVLGNQFQTEEDWPLIVLRGLGIIFLGNDNIINDKTIRIDDRCVSNDLAAATENVDFSFLIQGMDVFAREFLMPENLYDQSMVENMTSDGKFDCIEMAKDFGAGYMKVLTRGEDLGKWH